MQKNHRKKNMSRRRGVPGKNVTQVHSHRKHKRISTMTKSIIGITVLSGVIIFSVLFTPSFSKTAQGGIVLHGNDPEVEIYGPSLPENMVTGYSSVPVGTVLTQANEEENAVTYVYAAKEGKCYHLSTCKFAYASAQRLTIYEASILGYKPCNKCSPPVYGQEEVTASDSAENVQESIPSDWGSVDWTQQNQVQAFQAQISTDEQDGPTEEDLQNPDKIV